MPGRQVRSRSVATERKAERIRRSVNPGNGERHGLMGRNLVGEPPDVVAKMPEYGLPSDTNCFSTVLNTSRKSRGLMTGF
jgi:hypothetical protein